jgi:hypothetical protein
MTRRSTQVKQQIAREAARLIATESIHDFASAKRKAAERVGVTRRSDWPSNQEIDRELRAYQRLFLSDETKRHVRALREAAMRAMSFLAAFDPRLTGAVLDGTADAQSSVVLHLFADNADDVYRLLVQRGAPTEQRVRRYRLTDGGEMECPVLEFSADANAFQLVVFPARSHNRPPVDPLGRGAVRRASQSQLQDLLCAEKETPALGGGCLSDVMQD